MKFIVNILGGPGTGKTTVSSLVFGKMKIDRDNVEYVQEYAKNLVWRKDYDTLNNQYLVSKSQYEIFEQLSHSVDYIITDGSLLHGLYYNRFNKDNISNVEKTEKKILEWYDSFQNLNIFLVRNDKVKYMEAGRLQTKEEAKEIDTSLRDIFDELKIKYAIVNLSDNYSDTVDDIVSLIREKSKELNNFIQ